MMAARFFFVFSGTSLKSVIREWASAEPHFAFALSGHRLDGFANDVLALVAF